MQHALNGRFLARCVLFERIPWCEYRFRGLPAARIRSLNGARSERSDTPFGPDPAVNVEDKDAYTDAGTGPSSGSTA